MPDVYDTNRLSAHAPALLAMLKALANVFEDYDDVPEADAVSMGAIVMARVAEARALIAAVEGDSPGIAG